MSSNSQKSPYRFRWHVSQSGYEVVDSLDLMYEGRSCSTDFDLDSFFDFSQVEFRFLYGDHSNWNDLKGPWLAINSDSELQYQTIYDPMGIRTLHRIFAETPMTPEGIISFASEYGLLEAIYYHGRKGDEPLSFKAESAAFWFEQIRHVNELLSLLEDSRNETQARINWLPWVKEHLALHDQNIELQGEVLAIQSLIASTQSGSVGRYIHGHIVKTGMGSSISKSFKFTEIAKSLLEKRLNRILAVVVSPNIQVGVVGGLTLRPRNLLGAIYALLAEEITGADRPWKRCLGCGKWIQPLDLRKNTCNAKCRQRYYRDNLRSKQESQDG